MLAAQDLLDAFGGPAYVVDPDARFLLVGRRHWRHQVRDAAPFGPGSEPERLIGESLFTYISGEDVRELYRRVLDRLRRSPDQPVEFVYRCDSPGRRRELRMAASAVLKPELSGFLFVSSIVSEQERPPLALFEYRSGDPGAPEHDLPVLAICSMCHRVNAGGADHRDPSAWTDPEDYYHAGGTSRVSLSHGLCPGCYRRWIVAEEAGTGS